MGTREIEFPAQMSHLLHNHNTYTLESIYSTDLSVYLLEVSLSSSLWKGSPYTVVQVVSLCLGKTKMKQRSPTRVSQERAIFESNTGQVTTKITEYLWRLHTFAWLYIWETNSTVVLWCVVPATFNNFDVILNLSRKVKGFEVMEVFVPRLSRISKWSFFPCSSMRGRYGHTIKY